MPVKFVCGHGCGLSSGQKHVVLQHEKAQFHQPAAKGGKTWTQSSSGSKAALCKPECPMTVGHDAAVWPLPPPIRMPP